MVVVNVTGGGGTVAGREVMNSKPDGYTLFFPHTSLQTSFYTGTADFNYEAFKPICRLVALNQAFLIRASEKYKNLKEFIAYVRKNPGKVKAGCVIGSLSHYAILGLEEAANVKFRIVPQKGEAKRIVALKGKHIDFSPFTPDLGEQIHRLGRFQGHWCGRRGARPHHEKHPHLQGAGL